VNDGETLNENSAKDFKADNSCETAECTVAKATWLSKVDAKKKVGSMVGWLKSKVDADYLLRTDTNMFGSTDASYSPFIVRKTAVHTTTATGTGTSRHRALASSDARSAPRVTAEAIAWKQTARSARRAAMHIQCSTGRASRTRSTSDTSDNTRPRRGKTSALLPWTSMWMVARR
jgi:hypothetical protein